MIDLRSWLVEFIRRRGGPRNSRRCTCGEFWVRRSEDAFVQASRGDVRMLHSPRRCFDFNTLPVFSPEGT